MILKHFRKS